MAVKESVAGGRPAGTCPEAQAIEIPSFAIEGKTYSVDPGREACECPRARFAKKADGPCKHVALAEALVKMRSRRDLLPTEERIATEKLYRLAKRIYSKPKKRETLADSYDLYLEILGYRYATPRLVEAARVRHKALYAERMRGAS